MYFDICIRTMHLKANSTYMSEQNSHVFSQLLLLDRHAYTMLFCPNNRVLAHTD